jgi:hypothetical protein
MDNVIVATVVSMPDNFLQGNTINIWSFVGQFEVAMTAVVLNNDPQLFVVIVTLESTRYAIVRREYGCGMLWDDGCVCCGSRFAFCELGSR